MMLRVPSVAPVSVESGAATFGVTAIATRGVTVGWGSSVLRSLAPGPLRWRQLSLQVSALTHLAIPRDEQLMVGGDVVVLKLQQGHQLQAREQRQGDVWGTRFVSQCCPQTPKRDLPALSMAGKWAQGGCAARWLGARPREGPSSACAGETSACLSLLTSSENGGNSAICPPGVMRTE